MGLTGPQKGERTEDQVAGDPVGCDDKAAGFDRVLDKDLTVHSIPEPCDKLRISHAPVHPGMTAEIPEPATGKNTHFLRKAEPACYQPAFPDQGQFIGNRPPFIDSHGSKQEFFPVCGLQKGNPLQVINSCGSLERLQGGLCRQRARTAASIAPVIRSETRAVSGEVLLETRIFLWPSGTFTVPGR